MSPYRLNTGRQVSLAPSSLQQDHRRCCIHLNHLAPVVDGHPLKLCGVWQCSTGSHHNWQVKEARSIVQPQEVGGESHQVCRLKRVCVRPRQSKRIGKLDLLYMPEGCAQSYWTELQHESSYSIRCWSREIRHKGKEELLCSLQRAVPGHSAAGPSMQDRGIRRKERERTIWLTLQNDVRTFAQLITQCFKRQTGCGMLLICDIWLT